VGYLHVCMSMLSISKYVKRMARIVKPYCRAIAKFRSITRLPGGLQVFVRNMLSLFKSQESRDFEKAMDYLECSRTLMGSAIETHRAIVENHSEDFTELQELAAVVKTADAFLKKNVESISRKFGVWQLQMQLLEPERYRKIERIVNNAEKNMRIAREKAIHINHWVRFERPVILPFS